MIITELLGGLGNQMFQYAAGYALAKRSGAQFRYDKSHFRSYTLHSFALDKFSIEGREVNLHERARVAAAGSIISESSLDYDERFDSLQKDRILKGYWQSEKYFFDYRSHLLSQFRPTRTMFRNEDLEVRGKMAATTAISVHVRRGDYVTNKQANAVHGVLTMEYYIRARNLIIDRLGPSEKEAIHWFIFSDDPDWARESLQIFEPRTVVSHNGPENNFRDIELMASARHHIIANSSFSWWGAWLSISDGQVVVAPNSWFAQGSLSSRDIIPNRWNRL